MFCKICNKEFSNDKSGEGKFYTHLRFEHNISKKQYVILTEYDAAAPKCVCGCSEEAAWENRIGFREYAKGHRKFKHRVQQYIKQNGHPVCSFSGCSNETGFDRAEPRKYCSTICATADRSEMAQNRLVHQIEQMVTLFAPLLIVPMRRGSIKENQTNTVPRLVLLERSGRIP